MNTRKAVIRRGLAGGGVATLLLAVAFVAAFEGSTAATAGIVAWLVAVGGGMLAAGRRERIAFGSRHLEWPRVAAVAIALLALGWGVLSAVSLLEGDGITGLGALEVPVTVVLVGYFAWFARECWHGGVRIEAETFAVD